MDTDNSFGFDCLLFESCNLNCKFCLEAHQNNKIDIQWIRSLPQRLIDRFVKEFDTHKDTRKVTFRIWGGELFYDSMPDSMFDEYRKLVDSIRGKFIDKFPYMSFDFAFVSNGVFTNRDRVRQLLLDTCSGINLSYDAVDRFSTNAQESCMIETAEYFHSCNLLNEISITLTRPCINAYINNQSRLLDLRFTKKIDINYYIPNKHWEELLPTDDDLFNFFKWAIDNKLYSVIDLNNLLRCMAGYDNKCIKGCNCHNHISACKDCLTYNCVKSSTVLPDSDFYGDSEVTEDNVSNLKRFKGMDKRGCFMCEYNDKCPGCCWTSIIYKNYHTDNCPFKRIIKYLKDNKTIIEDFKLCTEK